MQIGIDVGRDGVKVVTSSQKIRFESRVGEWVKRNLVNDDEYEVLINGTKYFVSELAKESNCQREMKTHSKIHDETKILFLTAIGLVTTQDEPIFITTGLPIDQHTPETKAELVRLLSGEYTVKVGSRKSVRFNLHPNNIQVAPEMAGGYWDLLLDKNGELKDNVFYKSKIRGIDLGSRTVNYCTIDSRKYVNKDSGTLNYGMDELVNSELAPYFARKIVADLSSKWLSYNPMSDIVYVLGGGTIKLQEHLKQHFNMVYVSEDPVFANASGYFKMGVAKWKREQVITAR